MSYNWKLLHHVPGNHKFFLDHNSQKVSVCDNSGVTPDETDDGVLWLITDKPIALHHGHKNFYTPVFSVRACDERHIISNVREVLYLVRNFGMQVQILDGDDRMVLVPSSDDNSLKTIDANMRALLAIHGFLWYRDQTTDRVEAEDIEEILPAVGGFTVVYRGHCALTLSTALVSRIEMPDDLSTEWIRVHWTNIRDERRETSTAPTS